MSQTGISHGVSDELLIEGLRTYFRSARGTIRAVDGLDLRVQRGEIVALVGESGSGKSVTALAILRLLDMRFVDISADCLRFGDIDIDRLSERDMRRLRGRRIGLVLQDPSSALNPVFSIGAQLSEAVRRVNSLSRHEVRQRVVELLDEVRLPRPADQARAYPHQLSGGMRQRATIAMAIAAEPQLLIADEITTSLDVTTQRQIVDLLTDISEDRGMSVLFITHDLALAGEIADRIVVMYAGRAVEEGPASRVLSNPKHPYTEALVNSIPGMVAQDDEDQTFQVIRGSPPSPLERPSGCTFHPRCPFVMEECKETYPPYFELDHRRYAACWLHRA